MTPKDRVLAALAGDSVDRLPQFDSFWGEFAAAWRRERQPPDGVSIDDYYGVDIAICVAEEATFFARQEVLDRTDGDVVRRDGWGRTLRERAGAFFYEVLEQVAPTRQGVLEAEFDDPADDRRYAAFVRHAEDCRARELAAFCKIGGPFLRTTFVRGETDYLIDIAEDPAYARALADKMADHLLAVALESLRRGEFHDTGVWMFDDIAHNGGLFISERSFREVFLPGYERIVRGCKEAGARYFVFHSDGDIRVMLPYLVEIGVDGINPVEPRAHMDVVRLRRQYADLLTFIGGVDNSGVLVNGTPDDVRAHVAPIARAARQEGGIIVGTHSIGPDISVDNYEAYRETVLAA
ncbi:MAG: hypothetical protein HYU66_23665 [Armatimonadetes bacterium]|nr:hypothetical protein [Armatimonadota bacterium]